VEGIPGPVVSPGELKNTKAADVSLIGPSAALNNLLAEYSLY